MSTILKPTWSPATLTVPQPGSGGIDVWRIDFPQPVPVVEALRNSLSDGESVRAERFVFPEDRAQYIVMHGALRLLLADLLRSDARRICFIVNENGKPSIADFPSPRVSSNISFNAPANAQPLVPRNDANVAGACISGENRADFAPPARNTMPQFSISHTQGMGLLAISPAEGNGFRRAKQPEHVTRSVTAGFTEPFDAIASVGVDVEYIRPDFPVEEIAARYFSRAETAALRSMPAGEQRRAFFAAWVRKEAWVKAVGAGLDHLPPFDATLVKSLDDGSLGMADDPNKRIASAWLRDLEAGPSHAAALAVCGVPPSIRCMIWRPDTGYA